jgi:hypothetical protein
MCDCRKKVHDINNKLCVISAHAELLEMSETLSETGSHRIEEIVDNITYCARLLSSCENKIDMKGRA